MHFKQFACSILTVCVLATQTNAQELSGFGVTPSSSQAEVQDQAKTYGFTGGGFVAAPIPIKNPTLGTGLALGGGYLFAMDPDSADSYLGLGGFKTDNGSYGYGISGDIAWGKNRWNLGLTLGEVGLNYDYFVSGSDGPRVPISQDGKFANIILKYGITKEMLVGLNSAYIESGISLDAGGILPPSLIPDVNVKIYKVGPTFELDYRDDTTFPTAGSHFSFKSDLSKVESLVGDDTYVKTVVKYDTFASYGEKTVIGARATACSASADAPFFDKCGLGSVDSFRGFAFGEVLDDALLSLQGELRGRFNDRFGYVAFAGVGGVGSDFGSISSEGIRTAAGVGLRIRLSKKFPMDFSIDAARADTGNDTYYIYVGQRF